MNRSLGRFEVENKKLWKGWTACEFSYLTRASAELIAEALVARSLAHLPHGGKAAQEAGDIFQGRGPLRHPRSQDPSHQFVLRPRRTSAEKGYYSDMDDDDDE